MNILSGKLTYIMAAMAVIFGLYNVVTQQFVETQMAWTMVWSGLTVFGIRRAIN